MIVTKCDLCKKQIKDKPVTAGIGYIARVDLCEKCGKPIFEFLKKHKFIKKEEKRKNK